MRSQAAAVRSSVAERVGGMNSAWLDWKPEQFYDGAFMDKLRREGFIDAVYQQLQ